MILKTVFLPFDIKVSRITKRQSMKPAKSEVTRIVDRNYTKIFCIGYNKTGTTSLEKLLLDFGFSTGNQAVAEILAEDWAIHNRAERIIKYCHTADAFQDVPFMYPGLYKELDKAFPGSKFILTVRDSPDQWYNSLVSFQTKLFSSDKSKFPDEIDQGNALYRYKGWLLDFARSFWDYPRVPLYDENEYKARYLRHIALVQEYFAHRPNDLITINLSIKDDFARLCQFLNVQTNIEGFPWMNKT